MLQQAILRPGIPRTTRHVCLRVRSEVRNKSITAAIERGRSAGDNKFDTFRPERVQRFREAPFAQHRGREQNDYDGSVTRPGRSYRYHGEGGESGRRSQYTFRPSNRDNRASNRDNRSNNYDNRPSNRDNDGERAQRRESSSVESLPYTTAASEFIYGYSSVLAAIKANRRRFYVLYLHSRGSAHAGKDALVRKATSLGVETKYVGDESLQALDRASSGRPHNGFVLEASPLPVPPLTSLQEPSVRHGTFDVVVDTQSAEDLRVNGKRTKYKYKSAGWRHPFVLYVDGVLDEGNLGAISRSAYFLGVDAIVTPTRQSAPWSHIALKASAGAAEAIPIFKVNKALDFLGQSARAGWRIYASDVVPPAEQSALQGVPSSNTQIAPQSSIIYTQARSAKRLPIEHSPVESHPTILMMGAEGSGLRSSLLNLAHFKVGIRHGREVDEIGVDSLNVSVAASLLCYEMMQRPKPRAANNALF